MTDSIKRPDSIRFHGITGRYNEKLIRKFLVDLPERDPMVLKMFTARDRRPLRHLLGWSGEFAGKYLTSCGYAYRISGDEELKSTAVSFADELIGYIDGEGYLGPYAKECRLTGRRYPEGEGEEGVTAWEGWNHYHIMYGLDSFDDCSAPFDSFRLTDIPSDLLPVPNSDGATLTVSGTVLRDFCHLGMTGGSYRTWL